MSNVHEINQTMKSTTPTVDDGSSSPQEKHKSHGSKHSGSKGGRKTRQPPQTVTYKLVPMDRDPKGKGAPPIVKGKKGSNLKRIEELTGTQMRFLNRQQQREFSPIEINTNDARILRIEIDNDMTGEGLEDMTNRQRLNRACQLVAQAIQYWRDVAYPPPEEVEDEDELRDDRASSHKGHYKGHRHKGNSHQGSQGSQGRQGRQGRQGYQGYQGRHRHQEHQGHQDQQEHQEHQEHPQEQQDHTLALEQASSEDMKDNSEV